MSYAGSARRLYQSRGAPRTHASRRAARPPRAALPLRPRDACGDRRVVEPDAARGDRVRAQRCRRRPCAGSRRSPASAGQRELPGEHDRRPAPARARPRAGTSRPPPPAASACATRPTRRRASRSPRPTPRGRRPSTAAGRAGPAGSAPAGPATVAAATPPPCSGAQASTRSPADLEVGGGVGRQRGAPPRRQGGPAHAGSGRCGILTSPSSRILTHPHARREARAVSGLRSSRARR